jgi:hypothetical protein
MSHAVVFTLAALGIELVLLLLVFLAVSWFRNRAMRLRDLRAVRALAARVRREAPEREQAIGRYLEQSLGLSGAALVEARADLMRAELGLLQRFASVYGQRAAAAAARFDSDLLAALEPYRTVRTGGTEASAAGGDPDGVQLDALQEENRRLSKELQMSMETMSRMLKEYSTMFAAGTSDPASPVKNPAAEGEGGVPSDGRANATQPTDDSPGLGGAAAPGADNADQVGQLDDEELLSLRSRA